ncbi:DoxX family membrane protein, partial [Pseudomonas sp.]
VPTLCLAIFAEVLCPLLIITGVLTRLACLPVLAVLLVALVFVHPEWTLLEGQFAWLLLILFTTILIGGPGRLALGIRLPGRLRYA